MPRATAAIVVIGDEILSGKFADENAAFLIGELRAPRLVVEDGGGLKARLRVGPSA